MKRLLTPEQSLAIMQEWPQAWACEAGDMPLGLKLVEELWPFVEHLHECGLAASTIRRHLGELDCLGDELIRRRCDEDPPAVLPPLIEVVDEDGGPLLSAMDEAHGEHVVGEKCELVLAMRVVHLEGVPEGSGSRCQ